MWFSKDLRGHSFLHHDGSDATESKLLLADGCCSRLSWSRPKLCMRAMRPWDPPLCSTRWHSVMSIQHIHQSLEMRASHRLVKNLMDMTHGHCGTCDPGTLTTGTQFITFLFPWGYWGTIINDRRETTMHHIQISHFLYVFLVNGSESRSDEWSLILKICGKYQL